MKCKEFLKKLENDFPVEKALEWDNVGLLVGRDDKEINKIYVALDVTDAVLEEAILWGADLLLTHHPLIFHPLKQVNNQHFISKKIIQLIQADLSYYAIHTNYDIVRMADLASDMLGMESGKPLQVTSSDGKEGLGKIGTIAGKEGGDLETYAAHVKEVFGLSEIKVFSPQERKEIHTVAILPGDGKSEIELVIDQGADLYITGDISHHYGMDASERGLIIFDAGHYGIEHIFVNDMCNYINHLSESLNESGEYKGVKFEVKGAEKLNPYRMI